MKKMQKDFLLELQTEELPPKELQGLAVSLKDSIVKAINDAELKHGKVKVFATPRRLAILIKELSAFQPDRHIERRGPAWDSAFNKEDKLTKAGDGFIKSCGATVDELEKLETEKGAWVVFRKTEKGKSVFELMPKIVKDVIKRLPITKPMRWSNVKEPFSRPVHSIIMMHGRKVMDGKILGIKFTNKTKGHRFHNEKLLVIKNPADYEKTLKKQGYVLSDFSKRKEIIRDQICRLAKKHEAQVIIDEALLEEVTGLVEWPVALMGRFSKRFLSLPKEVLISTMHDHQKCFPVTNKANQLLPMFIAVSNLQSLKPQEVVKGNERVMLARLSDAEFFYQADCMRPLEDNIEELQNVVFQSELGSLFDKAERVKQLSSFIADKIHVQNTYVERAAMLSKADLVTSMVGEFPELQGTMGYYYALHDKEPEAVAIAIKEHYMPHSADAELPTTKEGIILALADRVDTLAGIFGINKMPTGDKDPFALRRAAIGIIRILALATSIALEIDLKMLLEKASVLYGELLVNSQVVEQVLEFILERLKYWLLGQGYTANQFTAVAANKIYNLPDFMTRLKAVKEFMRLPEAESLTIANKRVSNILIKQGKLDETEVHETLLKDPAEFELYEVIQQHEKQAISSYDEKLKSLAQLREPIDKFFDSVMVMDDDKAVRHNRLVLLTRLRALFLKVADISLL